MKAYELLNMPEKWCQGIFARNASGMYVEVTHPDAVSWCVVGAIGKCYNDDKELENYFLDRLARQIQIESDFAHELASSWNDDPNRTFAEVRQILMDLDI